jgi:hypothetical protein
MISSRAGSLGDGARRAVVAIGLVVAVLAGTGSGSAFANTPDRSTLASVPPRWDPRLKPIADEVAKLRALDFEHPVAASFLDDAAFEKKVSIDKGKLTEQEKKSAARSEAELRAVGLIGPDVDLVNAVSSAQSAGVLAFYDPMTKRITVKGTDLDDVATRVTVAHEMTHALQDQHFDLQKLEKEAAAVHGSTALKTVVEGDAVRIQNAYAQTLSSEDQQRYAAEYGAIGQQAQDESTSKGVPDTVTVMFQAPYALGESMLDAVMAKGQQAGIDGLFRDPPTADASFVTPSTLLDHRTFQKVKTPPLQPGERREGEPDVFGSLDLFEVLASRLDDATALAATDAWDGDAMVAFKRGGQTCLRVAFAGQGPKGVETFDGALHQWAAQVPPSSATVQDGGNRVILTACDPGSATTASLKSPVTSFAFLSNRNGVFAELMKEGLSTAEASCASDALVRDPAFAPFLAASANAPDAQPDPSAIDALRTRLRAIVAACHTT